MLNKNQLYGFLTLVVLVGGVFIIYHGLQLKNVAVNELNLTAGFISTNSPSQLVEQPIEISFTNSSKPPTAFDWIGIYLPNTGNKYLDWVYTSSCTKVAGTEAKSSGKCQFKVSRTGDYVFKLNENNQHIVLAESEIVKVSNSSISGIPNNLQTWEPIKVSFNNLKDASTKDWIGLYEVGNTNSLYWIYTSACTPVAGSVAKTKGVCEFVAKKPGQYSFKLYSNNTFTELASSNIITVADKPGIKYFGYHGSDYPTLDSTGKLVEGSAQCADHCNTAWILAWDWDKATHAMERNQKIVFELFHVFFNVDGSLRSDYVSRWNSFYQGVGPYTGSIVTFYHMDEPFYNIGQQTYSMTKSVMRQNLKVVNELIKSKFPNIPISVTFHASELYDGVNSMNGSIPEGYDWVSFDCYTYFEACHEKNSVKDTVARLKSKMSPGQKIFMVPIAFDPVGAAKIPNLEVIINDYYNYIVELGSTDSAVVGVFPYIWQGISRQLTGVRDIPWMRDKYASLAKTVLK